MRGAVTRVVIAVGYDRIVQRLAISFSGTLFDRVSLGFDAVAASGKWQLFYHQQTSNASPGMPRNYSHPCPTDRDRGVLDKRQVHRSRNKPNPKAPADRRRANYHRSGRVIQPIPYNEVNEP